MDQQNKSAGTRNPDAKPTNNGGIMANPEKKVKKKKPKLSEWLESLDFPEIQILAIIITKRGRYIFFRTPIQETTLTVPRHVEIDADYLCRLPNVMV